MGKIIVSSVASRSYAPDIVNFNIHICRVGANSAELTAYNKEIIDKLIEGMNELDIQEENLKETYFRISINREYNDGAYKENGYKLDSKYAIAIYIDYELMDSVRDMINDLGVEYYLDYSLEDESELRDELLTEAVLRSRDKAMTIASAGNMQVGEMKEVRYGEGMTNTPMLLRANATDGNATPKDIEITESVEVEWELREL